MNDFSEPISPEQFVSNQVRKITALSLEERSSEALKLAIELLDQYEEYPLVHRCIAKVYQRMDQMEVALKHHDMADQLSESFFKKSNPLIVPIRKESEENGETESALVLVEQEQVVLPEENEKNELSLKKKSLSSLALSQKFDEKELDQLREKLIETTRNDVLKADIQDIEPISIIKLSPKTFLPIEPLPLSQEELLPPKIIEKWSASPQEKSESFSIKHLEEKGKSATSFWIPKNLTLKQATCLFREAYVQQVFFENQKDIEKTIRILGISRENLEFLLGI